MKIVSTIRLSTAFAVMLLSSTSAFALDGDDFVAKLNAAMAAQGGGSINVEETDVDGSTITLTGVSLTTQANPGSKLNMGEITFDGVEESDGGYTVETTSFDNVDVTDKGSHFTVEDIEIAGLRIPSGTDGEGVSAFLLYDEFSTGAINMEKDGKSVAKIESTNATIDMDEGSSPMAVTGEISGIAVDLTTVDDPKSKGVIEALNLQNIYGNMAFSGTWDPASGRMDMTEYSFDARDIGKLDFALSISGYTTEFIKAMQQAQKAMAANPDKQAGSQSFGIAMMGLMQQLSFNSASIRFDDASITKRALDFAGKQQGVSGDQMAQMIKAMAPMMMARYNLPELQAQVSAALNTFLDDPQSLEIKAEPAQPVGVPMIMGAAMGAPQTLPNVLGVSVTANE